MAILAHWAACWSGGAFWEAELRVVCILWPDGGACKGKQPAPKKLKVVTPASPASLDDESEDPVNVAIVQQLEALVRKWGGPVS